MLSGNTAPLELGIIKCCWRPGARLDGGGTLRAWRHRAAISRL